MIMKNNFTECVELSRSFTVYSADSTVYILKSEVLSYICDYIN